MATMSQTRLLLFLGSGGAIETDGGGGGEGGGNGSNGGGVTTGSATIVGSAGAVGVNSTVGTAGSDNGSAGRSSRWPAIVVASDEGPTGAGDSSSDGGGMVGLPLSGISKVGSESGGS